MIEKKAREKFYLWYRRASILSKELNSSMLGQKGIEIVAFEGFKAGIAAASHQADPADAKQPCAHDWYGLVDGHGVFECRKCGALRR